MQDIHDIIALATTKLQKTINMFIVNFSFYNMYNNIFRKRCLVNSIIFVIM